MYAYGRVESRKKMQVKLSDVMYVPGNHTIGNITLQVSERKEIRAYLDGELFMFSPIGMSIATRATNGSTVKLKNALNKVFKAFEYPIVWTVEDGALCFTPESQSFSGNQELVSGTTYAYSITCNFHWRTENQRVNEYLNTQLKVNRYI